MCNSGRRRESPLDSGRRRVTSGADSGAGAISGLEDLDVASETIGSVFSSTLDAVAPLRLKKIKETNPTLCPVLLSDYSMTSRELRLFTCPVLSFVESEVNYFCCELYCFGLCIIQLCLFAEYLFCARPGLFTLSAAFTRSHWLSASRGPGLCPRGN
ncbi:hypothetical protein DPX16_6577 [Anabarilius grahami]|uniref:Uncharacterized protein n=1 Tax=Anabarilius grahami TaxID=495550 RepID=A0A3N0XY26_ANAGA|nr:hypothetical protein DPX16_6577 [Anabarilius grahami]